MQTFDERKVAVGKQIERGIFDVHHTRHDEAIEDVKNSMEVGELEATLIDLRKGRYSVGVPKKD